MIIVVFTFLLNRQWFINSGAVDVSGNLCLFFIISCFCQIFKDNVFTVIDIGIGLYPFSIPKATVESLKNIETISLIIKCHGSRTDPVALLVCNNVPEVRPQSCYSSFLVFSWPDGVFGRDNFLFSSSIIFFAIFLTFSISSIFIRLAACIYSC